MLVRLLQVFMILMAVALAGPSLAEEKQGTTTSILNDVEKELKAIDKALDQRIDAEARRALRERAVKAQETARSRLAVLEEQMGLVDAKIAGMGPVSPDVEELPEIRGQRAKLAGDKGGLDAAMKRARLLDVEARQLIAEIDRSEVAELSQKLTARTASPLEPAFWRAIADDFPRDLRRVEVFYEDGRKQIDANWDSTFPWPAVLSGLGALIIVFPLRYGAWRLGRRFLIEGAPGHRVRRSANAVWRVVVGTVAPLLAMLLLGQGLRWSGLLPERWETLYAALTTALAFNGFSIALGNALLMPSAPSWRLVRVGDKAADRLIIIPWTLSIFGAVSILLVAFNRDVGASAPASLATEALIALMYLLLIGLCLLIIARLRSEWAGDGDEALSNPWLGTATLFAWISVAVGVAALAAGYIAFSLFMAQLITWAAVLSAATYLLMIAVDDLAVSLFTRASPVGRTLTRALGIRGSMIDQFGVILSAFLRIALAVLALSLLMTPFSAGGSVATLFGQVWSLGAGIELGGISISFGGILRALVVLVIGLAVVRLFMRWLEQTYLPVTGWDVSGRNSFSLITRYVAISLAAIWALASLGIGMERVALLLSALSVGIGFGLQAITQNFVSGLILLAERPIKIGDLVRIGTDEGDVKRINVRSTEIVLGDHSTLIVPNSELITKSVLNKTLASPLGRVQVQFSVPIEIDPDRIRSMVLEAFAAETAILKDPKPSVFIDNIADGRIMFNGFAHVASPRASYSARSNVLMTILKRFRDEGIEVGTVPQKLELVQAPAASGDTAP